MMDNKTKNMVANAKTVLDYIKRPHLYMTAPSWVQRIIDDLAEAHNEQTYGIMREALLCYIENNGNLDDAIDAIQTDIYQDDLLEWLKLDPAAQDSIREANEIFGHQDDIYKEIENGQYLRIRLVIEKLHDMLEEIEETGEAQ